MPLSHMNTNCCTAKLYFIKLKCTIARIYCIFAHKWFYAFDFFLSFRVLAVDGKQSKSHLKQPCKQFSFTEDNEKLI